jgi:hypothetical protein
MKIAFHPVIDASMPYFRAKFMQQQGYIDLTQRLRRFRATVRSNTRSLRSPTRHTCNRALQSGAWESALRPPDDMGTHKNVAVENVCLSLHKGHQPEGIPIPYCKEQHPEPLPLRGGVFVSGNHAHIRVLNLNTKLLTPSDTLQNCASASPFCRIIRRGRQRPALNVGEDYTAHGLRKPCITVRPPVLKE